jgi:dihydrofolate reductase
MPLNLIYARAANGVIGKNNQLPWNLPEDLAHFRQLTQGCPVVMGRKTWDSLPPRFRPLPGRTNIVITRQPHWQTDGAHRAASLGDALAQCDPSQTVWVIGGAQIYAEALPQAVRLEVTELEQDFDGDAHAPLLGPEWTESARHRQVSTNGLAFSFVTYERSA